MWGGGWRNRTGGWEKKVGAKVYVRSGEWRVVWRVVNHENVDHLSYLLICSCQTVLIRHLNNTFYLLRLDNRTARSQLSVLSTVSTVRRGSVERTESVQGEGG